VIQPVGGRICVVSKLVAIARYTGSLIDDLLPLVGKLVGKTGTESFPEPEFQCVVPGIRIPGLVFQLQKTGIRSVADTLGATAA